MRCPGCGARVSVDVGIHGAQDLLVEVASGRYHDSTRCHAADPVRKAAREYIDARDVRIALDEDPLSLANSFIDPCLLEDVKLAALRAAMEG